MEWTLGTITAIGLRALTHRAEIERVGRKLIAHIVATEEIFNEVKALLQKVVPELANELSKAESVAHAPPPPPTRVVPPPVVQHFPLPFGLGHGRRR